MILDLSMLDKLYQKVELNPNGTGTFQQPTGMTGQDFINCKEINNEARALAANGWCGLFDIAGLFSDESAAVGTWKVPANTTDGLHPNSLGTAELAVYASEVFA